jgi:transposase
MRVDRRFQHMALPIHQRYEIVFLSCHPLGPKLGWKAVAKEVKCDRKTVKYWLDRWKESKDLYDASRSGRPRATTPKQDEQVLSLADQQMFVTSRDIQNQLKRKGAEISERTVRRRLNEAGAKFSPPMSKPLLTEGHQKNRLKWAEAHLATNWDQVIFSDETTIRLNQVKRRVWNTPGKKKVVRTVKHPIKIDVWGCFSSKGFGQIKCFKENLDAKLMCEIYKRYLLPTARDQFGSKSSSWKLQEDNDPKPTSKLATKWRADNSIQKIDWPSMAPDLAPIENVGQLLKMKMQKKKPRSYQSLVVTIE